VPQALRLPLEASAVGITAKEGKSARMVRRREDDPWAVSSTLTYAVDRPH
jgi:hypothetical protein